MTENRRLQSIPLIIFTVLVCLGLWLIQATAQSDTLGISNVSGVWVGIISWHDSDEIVGDVGTTYVYRMYIVQTDDRLVATHFTESEDILYTQPVNRFDQPSRYGFEGLIDENNLVFEDVPITLGSCLMSINLNYSVVNGEAILVGEWQPDFVPVATPIHTPGPNIVIPDQVVGCGTPSGGIILLRRFDTLTNSLEED